MCLRFTFPILKTDKLRAEVHPHHSSAVKDFITDECAVQQTCEGAFAKRKPYRENA